MDGSIGIGYAPFGFGFGFGYGFGMGLGIWFLLVFGGRSDAPSCELPRLDLGERNVGRDRPTRVDGLVTVELDQ
jgi:hypothetical protein